MHFDQLRRGESITLLGSVATWPVTARAQQKAPTVGFLGASTQAATAKALGLKIPESFLLRADEVIE